MGNAYLIKNDPLHDAHDAILQDDPCDLLFSSFQGSELPNSTHIIFFVLQPPYPPGHHVAHSLTLNVPLLVLHHHLCVSSQTTT